MEGISRNEILLVVGFIISIFVHEFGHYLAFTFFGSPSEFFYGIGPFGPYFVVIGASSGWCANLLIVAAGPLFSSMVMFCLSGCIREFLPAFWFQFFYIPFEVLVYITNLPYNEWILLLFLIFMIPVIVKSNFLSSEYTRGMIF